MTFVEEEGLTRHNKFNINSAGFWKNRIKRADCQFLLEIGSPLMQSLHKNT